MGRLKRAITSRIDRLSIRQRFLIPPFLGTVLLVVVVATLLWSTKRQHDLVDHLINENLAVFDQSADIFNRLTVHHLELFDLLGEAPGLDEAAVYESSKARIYRIRDTIGRLRESLKQPSGPERPALSESLAAVYRLAAAYGEEATSAVTMTTVDLGLAPRMLASANQHFRALSTAFIDLLNAQRRAIHANIDTRTFSILSSSSAPLHGFWRY